MGSGSFYNWPARFGGMDALITDPLKELENENRWLKKMYAGECFNAEVRKEALEKNCKAISLSRNCDKLD